MELETLDGELGGGAFSLQQTLQMILLLLLQV